LAAYETKTISIDSLHQRLVLVARTPQAGADLRDLLAAVDEATDLGRCERELVAWAASAFWRAGGCCTDL